MRSRAPVAASDAAYAALAVGWALDENNRALISPAMQARVTHVADDIIAGRIQVSDYTER